MHGISDPSATSSQPSTSSQLCPVDFALPRIFPTNDDDPEARQLIHTLVHAIGSSGILCRGASDVSLELAANVDEERVERVVLRLFDFVIRRVNEVVEGVVDEGEMEEVE
jgi:hypothetical protein